MDEKKIQLLLRNFARKRDWQKFHTPKNLATSISIEAAELLEIFQWSDDKLNIERQLNLIRKDGTNLVKKIVKEIKKVLSDINIPLIDITGREKKLCSIWISKDTY